jgi:hypothetical protein
MTPWQAGLEFESTQGHSLMIFDLWRQIRLAIS